MIATYQHKEAGDKHYISPASGTPAHLATPQSGSIDPLFEQLSDAIACIDTEGSIAACNQALLGLFGYSREELIGNPATLLFGFGTIPELQQPGTAPFDERHLLCSRKNGKTFSAAVTTALAPLSGSENRGQALLIRPLHSTPLELSPQALLDATAEGIFGLNLQGECTFCNNAAQRMLGFSEQELLGRPLHSLIAHTGSDGSRIDESSCLVRQAQKNRNEQHCKHGILWRRDGSWINVETRIIPLSAGSEQCDVIVCFTDCTEKTKLLEQQIRTSQLAAIGELATGVAHEINNPLSGVINYAQVLLNKGEGSNNGKDLLRRIIKEGERISVIVRNLLNFAHKDRDAFGPVSIEEIIGEPLQLAKQQIINDGIFLDIDISEDLPEIQGNAQRLTQVILNLLNNARYALNEKLPPNDPNKILRITAQQTENHRGSCLRLTMLDQGTGIPEQQLKKVFNSFYTTKPAGSGTGLGLSIAHDILVEHDAEIRIESDHGYFTMVMIDFPL